MHKRIHFLILTAVLLLVGTYVQAQKYVITGTITDRESHVPLDMANISLTETNQGTNADQNGKFEITNVSKGTYHLSSYYLGYEAFDTLIAVTKPVKINIRLSRTSLLLKEVNVMAREKKVPSTTSTIQRAAIENLQPSSMADVLQTLPGGLLSDSKLNVSNQVSMRQAGTDINTAMGTAIVQDGVPMSNDYNMQSFYGTTSADVSTSKSSVNNGVDLRQLSTDHIDQVEVIRGIPSVKYGDLTSGAIIIKSKKGETPLTLRVKSDPLNKLVYAGKGFLLPHDAGTVNFGIDYTKYVADQRSPFDKYQRITSNLSYEKLFHKTFLSTTQLAYTGTIDKKVNDPDAMNTEDKYQSDYKSLQFSNSGSWNLNKGMLNKVEYTISANYAHDVLDRTKTVTLNSPMGITLSKTAGESAGFYLPTEYLSTYSVDGKPFNLYSQVTTSLHPQIGQTFNNILLGGEFKLDKNFGDGALYDMTLPPFPTQSSSSRPRAPKDIPSMQKLTVFAEDNLKIDVGDGKIAVTAGLRATRPGNIAKDRAMYNKIYTEPRLNIGYQLPVVRINGKPLDITIKGGFGDQVKFPTAMQLYPETAYYDISELNYYSTANPANRFVYLLTAIKDRTNYDLTPARNRKLELGIDLSYQGTTLNVTAFHEKERNGFQTQTMYFPQVYKLYNTASYTGTGTPTIDDFTYSLKAMFLPYAYTTNAAVVVKDGIEYQLSTRKIKAINTEIVVN
ncbi:MAG: TonB-dependent receptor, partial [Bacteroidota bacterium]|nr:TonB-dependent receptor [Bacteroidota bacterium]